MQISFPADAILRQISATDTIQVAGKVTQVVGTVIEGHCPDASIGRLCDIFSPHRQAPVQAEIVGFRENLAILMPLGDMRGIHPGSKIISIRSAPTIRVGPQLLGRVLDAKGLPLDGGPIPGFEMEWPLYGDPINPIDRRRISEPIDLGVRCINGLLTCGIGQRMGIFSGSGVGKSVLLGMMARYTSADVNVIGLIGERGREVKEFIERDLGSEGLARSVVIAATSDVSPLLRTRGAFVATAIADYFREQGKNVLLMMDSVTRFCMAQREVGLAVGEPPTTKGYTPSVLALLPRLLEQAGMRSGPGSVTGIYNVLVEGDDLTDPVADACRSILDGHITLSRALADRNHFPAVDILASKSRLMREIVPREHTDMAGRIQRLMAIYRESETLINIGAYSKGTNAEIDEAIAIMPMVNKFLRQEIEDKSDLSSSVQSLAQLCASCEAYQRSRAQTAGERLPATAG
ncbi:MAG: FliI/YscN family ATPase [Candidatus Sumerlaeota bacterium]|nr:FliI/YscN family ATPase [Candidatus Sumerlaeota bacterium]